MKLKNMSAIVTSILNELKVTISFGLVKTFVVHFRKVLVV